MDPARVLLCDDAIGFPRLVAGWLSDAPDLELVEMVDHEAAGLAKAAELQPDVLLLDVVLPGGQITRELVDQFRAAADGMRVVLISSLPAAELEPFAASMGADGFCTKATTASGLHDAIRAALGADA
ncbi:response regulator [Conexibacter sp. SYSU D00693]|uniref:response regulator n=1 Tax=Conexibacter sp. SYSU D00693 TaxID=2812560 RepID=UPI00196BA2C4|nr:response regulator [Conexibacter sp. SYSU D00693]